MKKGFILTVLMLVLVAGAFAAGHLLKGDSISGPTITGDVIKQEISEISELAVLRFFYTDAGKYEDPIKFKERKIPLTTKYFIVSFSGEIKLGIKGLADIPDPLVDGESKEIVITLPPIEILNHTPDMSSVQTLAESNNLFNRIKPNDITDYLLERQRFVEETYVTEALRKEAEENLKRQIRSIVGNLAGVKDEFTVVFA